MGVPAPRDPELTRERLEAWFRDRFGSQDASVSAISGPAATGYSHETVIFDSRWTEGGSERAAKLVARVKPSSHTVFPDDRFDLEYRMANELSQVEGIPVPRVRWYEENRHYLGAPFFVMDHVEGLIPGDNPPYTAGGWLAEAAPEMQTTAWWTGLEAMAAVHRLDWEALGLEFVVRGKPGFAGEFDYWEDYLRWVTVDTPLPIAESALGWLREHLPQEGHPGLCWGDSRPGNQIFRDFQCVALLDWEMAAISDPEQDLGWWLYFDRLFSEGLDAPRPAGFPTHVDTIGRWESLTGRSVRNLAFFEVFAAYRFAVILMRVTELMKEYGQLPPDSDFPQNNFATQMLARVLDEVGAGVTAP